MTMYFTVLFFILPPAIQAYSFCPKCIHSSGTKDKCNLFTQHPLFKDNPEVNFIGKEICGEKGKYFVSEEIKDELKETSSSDIFQEKIMRIVRD